MTYNYFKLLRAQYSWKNDKVTFYINIGISLFVAMVYILFGDVKATINGEAQPAELFSQVTFILWMMWFGIFMIFHHTLKFIILGVVCCGGVTYYANYGEEKSKREAKDRYLEMMEWRQ